MWTPCTVQHSASQHSTRKKIFTFNQYVMTYFMRQRDSKISGFMKRCSKITLRWSKFMNGHRDSQSRYWPRSGNKPQVWCRWRIVRSAFGIHPHALPVANNLNATNQPLPYVQNNQINHVVTVWNVTNHIGTLDWTSLSWVNLLARYILVPNLLNAFSRRFQDKMQ